jgi:hypothetical protein
VPHLAELIVTFGYDLAEYVLTGTARLWRTHEEAHLARARVRQRVLPPQADDRLGRISRVRA